jgi:hypothetical protein
MPLRAKKLLMPSEPVFLGWLQRATQALRERFVTDFTLFVTF